MAVTTTARTLLASQTLAAGASINTTEWDMRTAVAGDLIITITNGASVPTTAPTIIFYSGEATGVKRERFTLTCDLTASKKSDYPCEYGVQHMFANAKITNGATNSITVEAYGQEATTL